jgi:hypothetical protein
MPPRSDLDHERAAGATVRARGQDHHVGGTEVVVARVTVVSQFVAADDLRIISKSIDKLEYRAEGVKSSERDH